VKELARTFLSFPASGPLVRSSLPRFPVSERSLIMLVLSRKKDERIFIGEVVLTLVEIRGDKVRLGFEAPKDVVILREELAARPRPPQEPCQKVA
jgi:carbon storage regulator